MPSAKESFFVRFAKEYGWRAYAIPVLSVITIWVLYDVFISPTPEPVSPTVGTTASSSHGGEGATGPNPADMTSMSTASEELPAGGSYTEKGDTTYRQVGHEGANAGQGTEKTYKYVVEVENGVDTSGYGGDDAFSSMVDATLTNPKSWVADPKFRFEHVANGDDADLHIQLTSVGTTHELCGSNISMETSCFYNDGGRVVLNESRWVRGATPFNGDVGGYRQYLINHEVGHGIGYAAHEPCGKDGELAPIMMQQTLSLSNSELFRIDPNEVYPDDNATCLANPWPYPRA
ncbi:DUF3152 domain-containing protein [Corynebacterium vitaeruminis]|uniref:DUF3152 domain-containing protein n=1 Tax=Corynebacterium vitaeruminis TaxID=38305 RepID=UPI0023EFBDA9|nr:DUF3152 domain-containing protein [Corynebacterium vitaeruminis]